MNEIQIELHFTGLIDIKNIISGDIITIKQGSSLADLLTLIGIRKEHQKYLIAMINEKKEFLHYNLKDKDIVKLFLPVGGG